AGAAALAFPFLHDALPICDERRLGSGTVAVQGVSDQLLACAGFTIDQHRDVGVAEATDGAEHLLHRRRFADDFRGVMAAGRLLLARKSTRLNSSHVNIS